VTDRLGEFPPDKALQADRGRHRALAKVRSVAAGPAAELFVRRFCENLRVRLRVSWKGIEFAARDRECSLRTSVNSWNCFVVSATKLPILDLSGRFSINHIIFLLARYRTGASLTNTRGMTTMISGLS
jgi:hypothetical protein